VVNIDLLLRVLSYIDEHLNCEMQTEEIASACFTSKSTLEKLFRYVTHFSVHDYILRRRMMKAAQLMIEKPNLNLLDVAVEYGYSSHEAFTRGFYQVWNCNPSEFREKHAGKTVVPEIFPQIQNFYQREDEPFIRRRLDISKLNDYFKKRDGCYCVVSDIVGMIQLNEIDRKAGDIGIITAMNRMIDSSSDDDIFFRIGADEFVLLTSSRDISYAEKIMNNILSMNGQTFDYEDKKVPLSLYCCIEKCDVSGNEAKGMVDEMISSILHVRSESHKKKQKLES